MLRRMNVVESDETTSYVEKDKSFNLAAAILYMLRRINVVESEETT